jgi:hypothetical protein
MSRHKSDPSRFWVAQTPPILCLPSRRCLLGLPSSHWARLDRAVNSKRMRNLRYSLLALILAAGVFLYWRTSAPRADASTVLTQVQQLNQLTTVRYTVQRIVTLTEEKHPVGSESILLIVQARVEAGVDLSSLRAKDIVVRKNGVSISLPPAQILNVAIDENETKVWDRQKTWWTPWVPYSLDLEKRARMIGLDSAKQSAIEMGILEASQRNAETSIRSLLGLAGLKYVSSVPPS